MKYEFFYMPYEEQNMSLYTKIIDLQKLGQSWQHVRKNKPAAGVDNVTYDMFEANQRMELKQLQTELQNHEYEALPVKQAVIFQGEKARTIALYSMRDKVLQQSIANELNRMYDGRFSSCAVAYRPNKSALAALNMVEETILRNKYEYALKLDIHHFFESIQWKRLEGILRENLREDDVIDLIKQNSITRVLDETGAIEPFQNGIHMGSGLAPILSNIYLMKFDRWMEEQNFYYLRYSDDMLILHHDQDKLRDVLGQIKQYLQALGLSINEKKTICVSLANGIDFLGHHFDKNGKSVPQKAKDNLQERLESMWLTSGLEIEEKIKKAAAIIGGWEQYFRDNRACESIFELVVLASNTSGNEAYVSQNIEKRKPLVNIFKDISGYLATYWQENKQPAMELYEYEQYYAILDVMLLDKEAFEQNPVYNEILTEYRKLFIAEKEENAIELMQLYTDLHRYETAAFWQEYAKKKKSDLSQKSVSHPKEGNLLGLQQGSSGGLTYNQETAAKIMNVFVGREDIYAVETMLNGTKRGCETQLLPLTEQLVKSHLAGETTLATYIQRPNRTVRTIVVDVDVSKKVLLQYNRGTDEFKEYMKLALEQAYQIVRLYERLGLKGYVEYSGCRGYHVWLLFSEWIPLRYANMFCDYLERTIECNSNINLEFFPNKTAVRPGKYGQCLKIPFGNHIRTGEQAYFLDQDGEAIQNINSFLDGLAFFNLSSIKKILAANTIIDETEQHVLEIDLAAWGEISSSVSVVLNNCNLMKYLCSKALNTGYLSHFERLSVLYVFAHLGESGQEFVHTVMSKTLNYQYSVTEKFIRKLPEKPISCLKLREQYKNVSAEYGCNCTFKRSKNCYPSPVLHAIATSTDVDESITIPTSRSLTQEKEKKVLEELNIHTKAEELANKILGLKKQSRKLDASIRKIESELSKLFDSEGIDCLEIEMGLLVRRRNGNGYEWIIEI